MSVMVYSKDEILILTTPTNGHYLFLELIKNFL